MSRQFVGRTAERAVLSALLDDPGPAVVFVHGLGGSGKSALLAVFAEDARAAGLGVVTLDLDALPTGASGRFLVVADECADPSLVVSELRRRWHAHDLDDALVVVASRSPLPATLRLAPGWPARLEVIELGALPKADALRYLTITDVDPKLHERIIALCRGNPIALRMLVELAKTEPDQLPDASLEENMALTRQLIDGIVEPVPSVRHRKTLQVASLVGHTTEDLLAAVLDDDAHELFEWLRRQPYITEAGDGLAPDDLVRDVIDADARWRDRLGYGELHRRAIAQTLTRIAAHTHDHDAVLRDASELLTLQRHRLSALPVQRSETGVRSVHSDDDLSAAPTEIARHVRTHGPLREGEQLSISTLTDAGELVAAMASAALASHLDPRLAWHFVALPQSTESAELLSLLDLHHVMTNHGNGDVSIYGHDWRRLGPSAWLRKITNQPWNATIPPVTGTDRRVLTHQVEFNAAVRTALRDLTSDRRLATNPLIDSRIVQDGPADFAPEQRLRDLVHTAAGELRTTDPALFRIVDRIYLRPSATQQQVAEGINLPFTTFRRWRNKAVAQIALLLWERERGNDRSSFRAE